MFVALLIDNPMIISVIFRLNPMFLISSGVSTQTMNSRVRTTSSDILLCILPRDESLGERWLEVLAPAVLLFFFWNHGGFPRTWYSGNHSIGRASQLRVCAHILAEGIPEVFHPLIWSSQWPASWWTLNGWSVCFWVVLVTFFVTVCGSHTSSLSHILWLYDDLPSVL